MWITKKQFNELKDKVATLEYVNEQNVICENCKCVGNKRDFFEVTKQSKPFYILYLKKLGIYHEYFCQKCKPDYDYIDVTKAEPKYYKTIAEHKVEVGLLVDEGKVIKRIKK